MHFGVENDDVYANEDDLQVLFNGLNENARNDLRVRNVNDLNELCTNDDLMYVGDV